MSEIADSKASFEGDLAVKSRKWKMQSTSNVVNLVKCLITHEIVTSIPDGI